MSKIIKFGGRSWTKLNSTLGDMGHTSDAVLSLKNEYNVDFMGMLGLNGIIQGNTDDAGNMLSILSMFRHPGRFALLVRGTLAVPGDCDLEKFIGTLNTASVNKGLTLLAPLFLKRSWECMSGSTVTLDLSDVFSAAMQAMQGGPPEDQLSTSPEISEKT